MHRALSIIIAAGGLYIAARAIEAAAYAVAIYGG